MRGARQLAYGSDQVFKALTLPSMVGCEAGDTDKTMAARVCLAKPAASLLYMNPAGLGNPPHSGIILRSDDPMLAAVLAWITDGAAFQ